MRQIRDDGRRAGAGAAAHTGGDEHHVGALENLGNGGLGLLGGLLADFGLGACAHASGELFTDLDFVAAVGLIEILLIGVDHHKFHAAHAGCNHPVDDVVAGAADADHFYGNDFFFKIRHG